MGGCSRNELSQKEEHIIEEYKEEKILFSWESSVITQSEQLFDVMHTYQFNCLYQDFSYDLEMKDIEAFLDEAASREISVYYLTGAPEWAYEKDGNTAKNEIVHVAEINKKISSQKRIKGIVLDIEPYLLEEWEDEQTRKELMLSYVISMESAYECAKEADLELVLCIPYFYDTQGVEKELEQLISNACDKIAIMNYYREKETEHMETEFFLATGYGKNVITIYEMKKPGEHGLLEENTYFSLGYESVQENFESVKDYFGKENVSYAIHDYEAFKEVINCE